MTRARNSPKYAAMWHSTRSSIKGLPWSPCVTDACLWMSSEWHVSLILRSQAWGKSMFNSHNALLFCHRELTMKSLLTWFCLSPNVNVDDPVKHCCINSYLSRKDDWSPNPPGRRSLEPAASKHLKLFSTGSGHRHTNHESVIFPDRFGKIKKTLARSS